MKTFAEMKQDQHTRLINQGFTKVGGNLWREEHYDAVTTDRRGLNNREVREIGLCGAGPDDEFNCLIIEYKMRPAPEGADK